MTANELTTALSAPHESTEGAVETAIAVYLAASGEIETFTAVKDAAKNLIAEIMTETAQTSYRTKAGKVSVSGAGQSVSYDAKALDALAASSDEIARLLAPHRKVTERAGTMRITGT